MIEIINMYSIKHTLKTMRGLLATATLALAIGSSTSCAARAAYNPSGQPLKICPMHKVGLKTYSVKTIYGLPVGPSNEYLAAQENTFPYAATPSLRGCRIGAFSWLNRHDRVRACPVCTEAREKYIKESSSTALP